MNYTYTQRVKRSEKGRFKAMVDGFFFYIIIFGLILLFFPVFCYSIIISEREGSVISIDNGEERIKE